MSPPGESHASLRSFTKTFGFSCTFLRKRKLTFSPFPVRLLAKIPKTPLKGCFWYLCPRQESNLDFRLRRPVSYPLNDEDVIFTNASISQKNSGVNTRQPRYKNYWILNRLDSVSAVGSSDFSVFSEIYCRRANFTSSGF